MIESPSQIMDKMGNPKRDTELHGITVSERYLAQLARRTFLSLWSHTNLFTDEGRKNGKGDGKELCDLIVVFENDVILFSDKQCAFPDHADINVAWGRWYRRAVEKSVNQLFGAEAWLSRYPERVFLDRQCSAKFPLPIPDVSNARFHRIAVTRGACEKCRQFYGGNSTGSLLINTYVQGSDHIAHPFCIGGVAPGRGYVHVLDELTLEVVLRELDTISDLTEYLRKKEELLTKPGRFIDAAGEEQLVAMYVTHTNKDGKHDFIDIPADINSVMIAEGYWEELISNPQYAAKKKADEISYAWDRLIEHFISHGGAAPGESVLAVEPALRVLASESRLSRRQLAKNLLEAMHRKVLPGYRFTRFGTSIQNPDRGYLFLILPKPDYVETDAEYRDGRRATLLACCKVAKLKSPGVRQIVGIATEPLGTRPATEDLVLLQTDGEWWKSEQEVEARELQEKVGIFEEATTRLRETHDKEYPDVPVIKPSQHLDRAERRRLLREQRRAAKDEKSIQTRDAS